MPDRNSLRLYGALAALALLLGPVNAYVGPAATEALLGHEFGAQCIASLFAGLILLILSRRNHAKPPARWTRAIWLLLFPQLITMAARSHLLPFLQHDLEWGITVGLGLAAPLWLALLAAVQLTHAEVPRTVAGCAIAALAALLLSAPTNVFTVALDQVPMLALNIGVILLTVFAWTRAAAGLRSVSAARAAARYLLLRALADGLYSLVIERTNLHDVVWRDALLWLALDALLTAAAMFLWFWLLTRMRPAAFTLHPLAIWTASMLGGLIAFGVRDVRMDIAAFIDIAAIWVGLRARASAEQPIALELG